MDKCAMILIIFGSRIGDVDIMKALTAKLGSATIVERSSLLSAATEQSNIDMVAYLMDQKYHLERTKSNNGATPFMMALQEGNADILSVLLRKDKIIEDKCDDEGKNMFHYALASRKPIVATKFLKAAMRTGTKKDPCMNMGMNMEVKNLLTTQDDSPARDTPLHILSKRHLDPESFTQLFTELEIVLGDLMARNAFNETPLHVAAREDVNSFIEAVLTLGDGDPKLGELLIAKDKDSNTPLHLVTQKKRPTHTKSPLLMFLKRTRDPWKYFSIENTFGETPFTEAVAVGDTATLKKMLKDLTSTERGNLVSHEDGSNRSPLHLAAEKGFVLTFQLLLDNGADIKKRGPDQKTALEVAIDHDQKELIESIIDSSHWEEAFKLPCSTKQGRLDTPLRMLIRQIPDLAEKVLDNCYERTTVEGEDSEKQKQDIIQMNFDLIEDTNNYNYDESKQQFYHATGESNTTDPEASLREHKVDINNHPLIIMANEKKVELLEHPVCSVITERKWSLFGRTSYLILISVYVIFLAALTMFILTSPSPINSPEDFSCTEFFRSHENTTRTKNVTQNEEEGSSGTKRWNIVFTVFLLLFLVARVFFFIWYGEFSRLYSELREIPKMRIARERFQLPNIPRVFLFDFLIYSLAAYLTFHSLFSDEPSCSQWQVGAVTITLAWINLLLHMRLLNTIGIYIIVFEDVILTFLKIAVVFVILLVGFALSFHILLSHRQEFENYYDALLKTIIMMSGDLFIQGVPNNG